MVLRWNYFIRYASEDKSLIAEPLACILRDAKFNIWYDDFSLKLGDSLLSTINKGLQQSRYGIVILSPNFFSKRWPQQELAGLFAREESSRKIILPVWHSLTAREIAKYSPILADRKGVETRLGVQAVAEQIVRATYPNRLHNLALANLNDQGNRDAITRKFAQLLEEGTPVDDIKLFISAHPSLLTKIVGYEPLLIPGYKLSPEAFFDFAVVSAHGVSGPVEVQLIILGPVSSPNSSAYKEQIKKLFGKITKSLGPQQPFSERPYNDYLGEPYVGQYASVTTAMQALLQLKNASNVHWSHPETWSFKLLVIAGRRGTIEASEKDDLIKSLEYKAAIASYDRLADE